MMIPAVQLSEIVSDTANVNEAQAIQKIESGVVTINGAVETRANLIVALAQDNPPDIIIENTRVQLVYS
jgi:hypothetical protein